MRRKKRRSVQIHFHLHISKYSLVPTSSKLLFRPPTDSHREATNHIMYILTSASLLFADFYSSFVIVRQKKMKKKMRKKPTLFSELLYSLSDIQYIYLLSLSLSLSIVIFFFRKQKLTDHHNVQPLQARIKQSLVQYLQDYNKSNRISTFTGFSTPYSFLTVGK